MLLFATIVSYPASGAFVSLAQATLMDLNQGRESRLMARWSVAGSLGNLAGPLVVAAGFVLGLGWRWAFASLAGLALLLTLALIPRPFPSFQPAHLASTAAEPFEASSHPQLNISTLFSNLWAALQNRALLRWIFLLEFSDLLLDVFTGYSALYFSDVVGLSPAQTSLALSVLMASSLVADMLLIVILERYPGRSVVRFSAALAIGVYISWLLAPWPAVKILLLVAVRFSTIGWYPVLQGEAYAAAPGRSGAVMALTSLGSVLGGALIWLVGWAAGQAGLATAMWLLLLGPLCLVLFVPKDSKATGDEKHYIEQDPSAPA
jgi:FSR family fosmidomycin resistance protein-like MFS transporter